MSVVWGVIGSVPFSDYTDNDLEDLIFTHIKGQWSLTGDLAMAVISDENRPYPFNQAYWLWVQSSILMANKINIGLTNVDWAFTHTIKFHIYSRRLEPSIIFPELGQMVREVHRILALYQPQQILGIESFDRWSVGEAAEIITATGETFQKTFEVIPQIDAFYSKGNIQS